MAAIYEETIGKVSASVGPGLSSRDIAGARNQLMQLFPDAASLRILEGQGYWEHVAAAASHMPMTERVRVFSLLWGEHPDITALFQRLCDALTRVGFASDVYCPREALFRQASTSGWPTRHPRSIITAQTLIGHEPNDDGIRVVARYGQRGTLTRADLAALVAEVHVATGEPPVAELAASDLISFPPLQPLPCGVVAAGPDPGGGDGWLLAVFAHEKSLHLFERASHALDFTSLVLLLDPTVAADDSLVSALGGWIHASHGATAANREVVPNGLVVAATMAGRSAATSALQPSEGGGPGWTATLEQAIGAHLEWLQEWVPGQAFSQTLPFHHSETKSTGGDGVAVDGGGTANGVTVKGIQNGLSGLSRRASVLPASAVAAPGLRLLTSNDGGAAAILGTLSPASQPIDRQRQIRSGLKRIRRQQRTSLMRFGIGADRDDAVIWRREIGTILVHRVTRAARCGRLGLLLAALAITEAELEAIAWREGNGPWRVQADGWGGEPSDQLPTAIGDLSRAQGDDGSGSAAWAHAAVSHWFGAMGRLAASNHLAAEVGLTTDVLRQLVDEIVHGAQRVDLVRHVAAAVARDHDGSAPADPQRQFAAIAFAVINRFLERLDILDVQPLAHQARLPGRIEVAERGGEGVAQSASGRARNFAQHWTQRLAAMLESNIAERHRMGSGVSDDVINQAFSLMPFDFTETSL